MNQDHYYVYALIDPDTDLPFYIGKGKGERCHAHLKETEKRTENIFKYRKIKSILNKGLQVKIEKIHENLDEETAYEIEEDLIKKYGRRGIDENGILTNICESGRPPNMKGIPLTEETKRKLSEAHKGKVLSEEHKKKLGLKKLGKKRSPETVKNFIEKMTGHPVSDETRRKISESNKGKSRGKGRKHTQETKDKMSNVMKGNTNGTYGKGISRGKGHKHTQESIQKMIDAKTIKLPDDVLEQIFSLRKDGKTLQYIADHLGLSMGIVRKRLASRKI